MELTPTAAYPFESHASAGAGPGALRRNFKQKRGQVSRFPTRILCRATKTTDLGIHVARTMIMTKRASSSKRELINTGSDKRYVRRDARGQFKESDDVGRSLAQDRSSRAKTKAKRGQGDRGDR